MKTWRTVFVAIMLTISTNTNAALLERLGGLAYYDNVSDLTWLADANAAGRGMDWYNANNWARNLNVAGVTGWRLPNTDTTCIYYNCTGSEMGNLFYNVLGGVAGNSINTTHNTNYYLFSNIQTREYWSATSLAEDNTAAWFFIMYIGIQVSDYQEWTFSAWAVHSGDVGAVPVPSAVWLFASGLLAILGMAKRKAR